MRCRWFWEDGDSARRLMPGQSGCWSSCSNRRLRRKTVRCAGDDQFSGFGLALEAAMVVAIIQWGKIDWPNIGVNNAFALFVLPTYLFPINFPSYCYLQPPPWAPTSSLSLLGLPRLVRISIIARSLFTDVLPNNQC
jgi:hypothetical protein